jgi:hypothetical protein
VECPPCVTDIFFFPVNTISLVDFFVLHPQCHTNLYCILIKLLQVLLCCRMFSISTTHFHRISAILNLFQPFLDQNCTGPIRLQPLWFFFTNLLVSQCGIWKLSVSRDFLTGDLLHEVLSTSCSDSLNQIRLELSCLLTSLDSLLQSWTISGQIFFLNRGRVNRGDWRRLAMQNVSNLGIGRGCKP